MAPRTALLVALIAACGPGIAACSLMAPSDAELMGSNHDGGSDGGNDSASDSGGDASDAMRPDTGGACGQGGDCCDPNGTPCCSGLTCNATAGVCIPSGSCLSPGTACTPGQAFRCCSGVCNNHQCQ